MSRRLGDLLVRWEEDSLSPDERQELVWLLEEGPAARRALVREWSLSSALARVLAGRAMPGRDGWREHTARHLAARGRRFRQPRRTLPWAPLAAAALLLLAVGGWFLTRGPEPLATVVTADRIALAPGATLPAGSAIVLPVGASLRLSLVDGSEVVFSDQARARLDAPGALALDAGRAALVVAPRTGTAPPFVVRTPHGRISVLGTAFAVSVAAPATRVEVDHGRVRVTRPDGLAAEARAGERAELRTDRAPVAVRRWTANDREALLITATGQPDAAEQRVLDLMRRIGFGVRILSGGSLTPGDLERARLAVICSRVALPDLEKRVPRTRCPLVVMDLGAWELYGFPIASRSTAVDPQPLRARAARPHPLAAGLSPAGELARAGARIGVGIHGPHAVLVRIPDGAVLVAAREPGETLPDGSACTSRRVAFFASNEALPLLTPDGWRVLEASLRWVAEVE